MFAKRVVVIAAGGLLTVGGLVAASGTALAHNGSSGHSPGGPPAVTSVVPTSVTEEVAGLGTVVVTIDPATGQVSSVTVTPIAGVTTGPAVPHGDRLEVPTTLADGTQQTLRVKAEHGKVEIELKNEAIERDEATTTTVATTPTTVTPPTTVKPPTTPTTMTTPTTEANEEANEANEEANEHAKEAAEEAAEEANEHHGNLTVPITNLTTHNGQGSGHGGESGHGGSDGHGGGDN